MAIAKICDRCGNVYAKNEFSADFGPNKYGTVKGVCVMFEETDFKRSGNNPDGAEVRKNMYMDLCDSCARQHIEFLKDKGAEVQPGPVLKGRY